MNIEDFVQQFRNHPVLFVGTGMSKRYLEESYTWDELLCKIAEELWENDEKYLDIKSKCIDTQGRCNYPQIATILENEFNNHLENEKNGKYKQINDIFYDNMRKNIKLSRFKLFIAQLLRNSNIRDDKVREFNEFKKIRKNVASVITTNYDTLIEEMFDFNPLIGNDILLSNPYGSVYKIHGCVKHVSKIIITKEDYEIYKKSYDLIRAQMLSLFIHNPIIFLGYSIGDDTIKDVLNTIFYYVESNSEKANRVRNNFLLVEYEPDSRNTEIIEHDIETTQGHIRINKLKTDDYSTLYKSLAKISLPVSVMDIRKVQSIVKNICKDGDGSEDRVNVRIETDLDKMKNSDILLLISDNTKYHYLNKKDMIIKYFDIVDKPNETIGEIINKQQIAEKEYFPIYGFSKICSNIDSVAKKKENQKNNIEFFIKNKCFRHKNNHTTIEAIQNDTNIPQSYKYNAIMSSVSENKISLEEVKNHIISLSLKERNNTINRRLLCLFDYMMYK